VIFVGHFASLVFIKYYLYIVLKEICLVLLMNSCWWTGQQKMIM